MTHGQDTSLFHGRQMANCLSPSFASKELEWTAQDPSMLPGKLAVKQSLLISDRRSEVFEPRFFIFHASKWASVGLCCNPPCLWVMYKKKKKLKSDVFTVQTVWNTVHSTPTLVHTLGLCNHEHIFINKLDLSTSLVLTVFFTQNGELMLMERMQKKWKKREREKQFLLPFDLRWQQTPLWRQSEKFTENKYRDNIPRTQQCWYKKKLWNVKFDML